MRPPGENKLFICKCLWRGDYFWVSNRVLCPFLSALEPYLVQTHSGPVHSTLVSVSAHVSSSLCVSTSSLQFPIYLQVKVGFISHSSVHARSFTGLLFCMHWAYRTASKSSCIQQPCHACKDFSEKDLWDSKMSNPYLILGFFYLIGYDTQERHCSPVTDNAIHLYALFCKLPLFHTALEVLSPEECGIQ